MLNLQLRAIRSHLLFNKNSKKKSLFSEDTIKELFESHQLMMNLLLEPSLSQSFKKDFNKINTDCCAAGPRLPRVQQFCSLTKKKLDQKLFFYLTSFELFYKDNPGDSESLAFELLEQSAYKEL